MVGSGGTKRKAEVLTHELMPMICVSWLNLTALTEVCRFMSALCGVGLVSRAAIVSAEYTFTTPVCDLQPQSW